MTNTQLVEFSILIKALNQAVSEGLSSLTRAGQIVVELNKNFTFKEIAEESAVLTIADLKSLKAVGERKLSPELLAFKSPSTAYLAKTPLWLQEEALVHGINTLVEEEGKLRAKILPISKLKHEHCKVIFDGDKIRSIPAQKAYLKNLPAKTEKVSYAIVVSELQVYRPMTFTKKALQNILAQM